MDADDRMMKIKGARRFGGRLLVWGMQGFIAGDRDESQTKGENDDGSRNHRSHKNVKPQ